MASSANESGLSLWLGLRLWLTAGIESLFLGTFYSESEDESDLGLPCLSGWKATTPFEMSILTVAYYVLIGKALVSELSLMRLVLALIGY